jgi:uncharacterized protein YegJ (DUF2314 family)
MRIDPLLISATIACAIGVYVYVRWRSPRPEFPPLPTAPDEPLLIKAMADAKATLPQFLALARARPDTAIVKLRFVSNSNQVEHLWAEVLEVVADDELKVRLVTPPVSHTGELDRLYTCRLSEIEDWQARDAQGKIHGGFTQRAMYAIARREGVKLPKKLLDLEKQYADAGDGGTIVQ